MAPSQPTWLSRLGRTVSAELARSDRQKAYIPKTKFRPEEAESVGWYVTVARLKAGGALTVFLDESTGARGNGKRLWFGFATTDEARCREIAAIGDAILHAEAIEDDSARTLRRDEFGRPHLERYRAREWYYGIYLAAAPDISRLPSRALVRRIASLASEIGSVLADVSDGSLSDDEGERQTRTRSTPSQRVRRTILARRGQSAFRARLIKAFRGTCCISGSTVKGLLEAAHIDTMRKADDNRTANGLLLRADLHTLFDLRKIRVHPARLTVELTTELRRSEYAPFHGRALAGPEATLRNLDRAALTKRWRIKEHM